MYILYEVVYGSRLYGTHTPESDLDIKGVYAPSKRNVLNGTELAIDTKSFRNKNDNEKSDKDTIEYGYYSLCKFFNLLAKGDIACTEMLFVNKESVRINESRFFIERVLFNNYRFISKKITSFVYCAESNLNQIPNLTDFNKACKYLVNAYRLNLEITQLIDTGRIEFPLKDMFRSKDIINGYVDFGMLLEYTNYLCEKNLYRIAKSHLPDSLDIKFLINIVDDYYKYEMID